ncbi:cardiolipin synthase [Kineosphaera limosa]|uniref:Putative cardiolipin synthase n=1 Tax=Kineosphaera limosa NBRC 100340 TaxID=1184609 RepID=K6XEE3_9MICO|nr:phospholipase D-like domain-containing protein [Kineosphaera limosa]NYE02610.1 cardiolipin synthase [Kineosphaera limosa]GAB97194.1 putative cardiolipin synthase [Kineosphaera limosa NBRC 100340]
MRRRLFGRRTRAQIVRAVGYTLLAGAAAQVAAAAAVISVDEVRKRRATPAAGFPSAPPRSVDVVGNRITTYTNGEDLYEDMLTAIEGAKSSIFFEFFIWKDDEIGTRFKDALIAAAERGVHVFVIYDGFANLVVDPRFYRFPDSMHVLRFPVVRWGMLRLDLRHFGRDHRKIVVVDGDVGFVGGYNIGDLYATSWRDTHLRVQGPAVWELTDAFVDFWNEYRHASRHPELPERGAKEWNPDVRAARNAPSRMLFPVRGLYIDAIERAATHIYITQAYFIPDNEILTGLLKAARRGVDVRVIVPEYSNHIIADWVSRGYYSELLAGGVTIWLYRDAMVHAKTATVDGMWSTVGTANIDRLSMIGNYEVNLALYSDDMAAKMQDIFEMDLGNCRQLTLEEWEQRGRLPRIAEALLNPLHPLM